MRGRRILAGLSCGVLMVTALSACGSNSASSDNTLEVLTGMANGSEQLKALKTVTEKFENANPDIKVKLVERTNSYEQDIKVRLSARNAPDIFNTHGWSRDRYANFLEDLSKRPWAKNLTTTADTVFRKDDKSFYALPMDVQVTGLFYNQTVLDKAGVDADSIATWDDFSAACEKVKAVGATCIGNSGKEGWAGNFADFSASGLYSDKDKEALKKGTFDTAAYEKVGDMIRSWAEKGYINVDYSSATADDVARMVASDQAAFVFQPNSLQTMVSSYNPDAKLGFIPVPSGNSDPYLVVGEDYALGVSKTSKHKDAALKYIDFLAKTDNMKTISDSMGNAPGLTGVEPKLGKVADSYTKWVDTKKTALVPFFDRVYLPNGMWSTMVQTSDGLVTGQLNAKSAAEQMKTSFDGLYGQKS